MKPGYNEGKIFLETDDEIRIAKEVADRLGGEEALELVDFLDSEGISNISLSKYGSSILLEALRQTVRADSDADETSREEARKMLADYEQRLASVTAV